MVLFVIFCPIIAAILIMAGAPARKAALVASVLAFAAALFLLAFFDQSQRDFQHVTSFTISPDWHLSFTTGIDGLSLVMILLATIVTLAAVLFTGTIEKYENAFYACLLFISGGAIGAFASIDLFFFYAFHELALIPTFLLIGIWGSGNRVAAAWKITIYLAIGSFILLLGLILLYQRWSGHHRAETARLDAWLLERNAYGLYFPGNCECHYSLHDRRRCVDVCSWTLDCPPVCLGGGTAQKNGHVGFR